MRKIWFSMGILLCLLPLILQIYENSVQEKVVDTYISEADNLDQEELKMIFREAEEYNNQLWNPQAGTMRKDYQLLLNPFKNGIMGSMEIPQINLKLPIYHGTDESVLSCGIGHLKGSSLPVGGENTHCILTGHRGLPSAQLFTRLDELEEGDLFYLYICNQTLVYQVNEIQVVKPEEADVLEIKAGRDLVSLVTCTPYGINTHRLVVTGERVMEITSRKEGD